jgi:zinc/manganese transport system substrate-binding protein
VIGAITAEYRKLEPDHAAYFARRRTAFEAKALERYRRLIAQIKRRYGGTPVGASESIFAPLAAALGLKLLTPAGFLDAISEGTEPTPSEKATVDRQITGKEIAVWVYNPQNATPDIQRLNDEARSAGIPIATVTETPTPAGASFEAWQARELGQLRAVLVTATGR